MTSTTAPDSAPSGIRLLAALLAAVATASIGGLAASRALHAVAPGWASDADRMAAAIVMIVYLGVATALLATLGTSVERRRHWLRLLPVTWRQLHRTGWIWAGAYVAAGLAYTIFALAGMGIGPSDVADVLWAVGADNGRLHGAGPAVAAVILIRIGVVVPVAEELLFRGAMFSWLRSRLPAGWTIALTAVGFALIHQAPAMMPLALLVGVAAGVIREWTGSVTVPIVLHAIQNVAIVALSYLATGWQATMF